MTRDADCQHIIWQRADKRDRKPEDRLSNKPMNWLIKAPADWKNITGQEWQYLSEILEKIKIKHSEFRELNPLTGEMQTKDSWVIRRYVEKHNYSIEDRREMMRMLKRKQQHSGQLGLILRKLSPCYQMKKRYLKR